MEAVGFIEMSICLC